MRSILLVGFALPLIVGCGGAAYRGTDTGDLPRPTTPATKATETRVNPEAPLTSAGDRSQPVPFVWTTHQSHRATGNRLIFQGGTIHALPERVRLLDPAGKVVATADTRPPRTPADPCPGSAGIVRAELPMAEEMLTPFLGEWPAGYRVEAQVGGTWLATETRFAGCRSIE